MDYGLRTVCSMNVAAIVPAAGAGTRLGGRTGKLFVALHQRPLLAHTLQALQGSPSIRWIVLVVRAGEQARARALLARYRITKAVPPCVGGASRAQSVAKGFAAVPAGARWVLIHDAARPCVSRALIQAVVRATARHGAVVCGLPSSLTIKAVDEQGAVRLTLDREQLWLIQTPQLFRTEWFAQALRQADQRLDRFPDDASLVESAGFPVCVVPGDPLNVKVTTREDLLLAAAILEHRRQSQNAKLKRQNHKPKVKTSLAGKIMAGHF